MLSPLTPRSLPFSIWLNHLPFFWYFVVTDGNVNLSENKLPSPWLCSFLISSRPKTSFYSPPEAPASMVIAPGFIIANNGNTSALSVKSLHSLTTTWFPPSHLLQYPPPAITDPNSYSLVPKSFYSQPLCLHFYPISYIFTFAFTLDHILIPCYTILHTHTRMHTHTSRSIFIAISNIRNSLVACFLHFIVWWSSHPT